MNHDRVVPLPVRQGVSDGGVAWYPLGEVHELSDAGDGVWLRRHRHTEATRVASDDAVCIEQQSEDSGVRR